jgi:hypothetical protein
MVRPGSSRIWFGPTRTLPGLARTSRSDAVFDGVDAACAAPTPAPVGEGQPVVTGFSSDTDMPVLTVAEHPLFEYEHDPSRVAIAVGSWQRLG